MGTIAPNGLERGFWLDFNPHPSESVHEFC